MSDEYLRDTSPPSRLVRNQHDEVIQAFPAPFSSKVLTWRLSNMV
jgi:hypothetical protein